MEIVTFGGGEDLANRFVGVTLQLEIASHRYHREAECRTWLLEDGQEHRRWLTIDDIADWFSPPPNPNYYRVNPETGLTAEDVKAIIAILGGKS